MTDGKIEAIARAWCANMGRDPDALHTTYEGAYIPHGAAYWRLISTKVREHLAMHDAILSQEQLK